MREQALKRLLETAGWADAVRRRLAGDASNRSFHRLCSHGGATVILMDADPRACGPLTPFIRATTHLRSLRLSAPEIIAADEIHGFLLLEDLGDALFARVAGDNPQLEEELYFAVIDLLAELRSAPSAGDFPPYSPPQQAGLAALSFEWYRPAATSTPLPAAAENRFRRIISGLISALPGPMVFVHRDCHAENLIWLPERVGIRRVGLIDYQDAALGHPAYDLVSLLEDARRDIAAPLREASLRRYCDLTGVSAAALEQAIAICGAQRNLRIIGVFARLAIRDGKPGYLKLLPRVWAHLMHDLSQPVLAELAEFVTEYLPGPDAATLRRIGEKAN
ncbi:MAG: phosphotransferase [Rhodobacteraceae bacterium]|nr:phosphotransferase [Paracoccaceae bacterium]